MEGENGHFTPTMFVKVHKQGCAIARRINLRAHDNYESLRRALEEMSRNFLSSQVFVNTAKRLYIVRNPEAAATGKMVAEELLISSSQVILGGCFMYRGGGESGSSG
ncbi:AUX/IAA family [Musa troglodytarum]|uniref:Auxin-responsive protein n=1 Tax=Musa troglodytarum TaxID=320322 RepID=A0A9E7HTV6_9LILI|nr:AUX/IAA family [Musa troglodytarum]